MSNTNFSLSRAEAGGKGFALLELARAGFNVPAFTILPVQVFEAFAQAAPSRGETVEDSISAYIADSCKQFLPGIEELVGSGPYAVRSSSLGEDGAAHSFAGQFKTMLGVDLAAVPAAIAEVWLSSRGAAAAHYAATRGVGGRMGMAVIIQQMVEATAAGVAFSANPLTGTDELVINAVPGLGDKLVDGSITADSYTVRYPAPLETHGGILVDSQIVGLAPALSEAQVLAVASEARRAHLHFGCPQDVEFAFCGEQLYILQARPITTLPAKATVWDNSNIIESYPGLTGPLTFSFIEKMYEAVYRQFASILGVGSGLIEGHTAEFASMLGLLNGRVYYNLNSWYTTLALLPGYSLNAAFMEKMMGVKERLPMTIAPQQPSRLVAWWQVAGAVGSITKNLAGARAGARHFINKFDEVYSQFAGKDFGTLNPKEIWADYTRFEALMVSEWKAPLVNDFFAMIYFGLLQKLCARHLPEDANLHNRLLAGSEAVLTTEPMRELPRILDAIRADAALLELGLAATPQVFLDALAEPRHAAVGRLLAGYIERWGERTLAELKLETITYREDPLMLIGLLQSQLVGYAPGRQFSHGAGRVDRLAAEATVAGRLRGRWLAGRIFGHVLAQARYFVTERENLRYYRTRGFGMVRRMMLGMGECLAATGHLPEAHDIFWLTLPEVAGQAAAASPMHVLIAQRKVLYNTYEAHPLPARIISYGTPRGLITRHPAGGRLRAEALGGGLQGIPCSAGVVRARVRKVGYADTLTSLDGAILATYATDPGFVVLFSSASGILTERGSLLSHAAIVSREMGIPCVVGIEDLMEQLEDGEWLEMDGSTGTIKRLAKPPSTANESLPSLDQPEPYILRSQTDANAKSPHAPEQK